VHRKFLAAIIIIVAALVGTAAYDDLSYPRSPPAEWTLVGTDARTASVIRPWSYFVETVTEARWIQPHAIVQIDEDVVITSLRTDNRDKRESKYSLLTVDFSTNRCAPLPWSIDYPNRSVLPDLLRKPLQWTSCPESRSVAGLIDYLRTTYAKETSSAREFTRALRKRLAEGQPSRGDRLFLAFLFDWPENRILQLDGEKGLLCGTLTHAAQKSDMFLTLPDPLDVKLAPNEGWVFKGFALRHGRIPLRANSKCPPPGSLSLNWTETMQIGPGRMFTERYTRQTVIFHDGSAVGKLEIRDGDRVTETGTYKANAVWPYRFGSYVESDFPKGFSTFTGNYRPEVDKAGRRHRSAEISAAQMTRAEATAADFPGLRTIAAPISRDSIQVPKVHKVLCWALLDIANGFYVAGLKAVDEARRSASAADRTALARFDALFSASPPAGHPETLVCPLGNSVL
jgi:hypothetical protein